MEVRPILVDQGELRLWCLLQQEEESLHGRLTCPDATTTAPTLSYSSRLNCRSSSFGPPWRPMRTVERSSSEKVDGVSGRRSVQVDRRSSQRLSTSSSCPEVAIRPARRLGALRSRSYPIVARGTAAGLFSRAHPLCHCFRLRWSKSTADSFIAGCPPQPGRIARR